MLVRQICFYTGASLILNLMYVTLWRKIWNNVYLSSYSHHQNSQGHMYTCKIQLYCYKLHLHDKVGRSYTRQYLRWVETKRMDLTVFLNVHFAFHLFLWYYKYYIVLNEKRLSNRTRWFYILIEIITSSCLSVSTHR